MAALINHLPDFSQETYTSIACSVVGGGCGFLFSYPVDVVLFSFNPLAGFISGATTGFLFGSINYDELGNYSIPKLITLSTAIVAFQSLITYGICLASNAPVTFTASVLFPLTLLSVVTAVFCGIMLASGN